MATLDPIETLRRVPFFAVLPPDEIRALAAHCVVRRLRRDEMLFAEGDSCGGLFVVQAGAVKQFKMAETGREQVLVTERAGSTVGELALFDGGNFPASAAAVEDSTVLYLPKREFLDLCRHNSGVAFAVIRSLASRSRYLTSLVEEGLGYALLPPSSVRAEVAEGRLEIAAISKPAPMRELTIASPIDHPVSAATALITDLLRKEIKACRDEGLWDIHLS